MIFRTNHNHLNRNVPQQIGVIDFVEKDVSQFWNEMEIP